MDECDAVKCCQAGDARAFTEIFKQYGNKALRTAYLITKNTATAEEAVQEAFVECFRSIGKLRNPQTFQAWFYKILVRISWKLAENERKHTHLDTINEIPCCSNDFTDDVVDRDALDAVKTAIDNLDNTLRMVVILYYFNELSVKQIAKCLNCFEGTVKSRLYTARKKLQQELTDAGEGLQELGFQLNLKGDL